MGLGARAAAAAAACVALAAAACPPEGFESVENFDLTAYVSAPWFVQQQAINSYQPADSLYLSLIHI